MQNKAKSGIIDIEIDEFTPCLRDTKTGEIIKTEVTRITDKTLLKDYNEKTGWNVDWAKTPKDVDVYALHIQGQDEIQGLIGIRNAPDMQAVYVHWASTAPRNNKLLRNGQQDYAGVGVGNFEEVIICKYDIRKFSKFMDETGRKWEDLTQDEQDSFLLEKYKKK